MASRQMNGRTKSFGVDLKFISLRIFPNAASAPTFTSEGGVASVALQATGLFRITLQDSYRACVSKHATVSSAANNVDLYPQFQGMTGLDSLTAPVVVDLALKTGTANTNAPAAAANNHIDVLLWFDDSAARTP